MIKKLIFFAISAYTISFFASHNKGSLDLSSPGSVWGSQELVKQTIRSHELDVVTHVKPLQSLILGYLGEFEYSEDVTKAIVYQNPQNYAEVSGKFIPEFGSEAWEEMSDYVFPGTRNFTLYTLSLDKQWTVRGVRQSHEKTRQIEISHQDKLVKMVPGFFGIMQMRISPDNTQFMASGFNKHEGQKILFYCLKTGDLLHTVDFGDHDIKPRFSPDGKYIAYCPAPTQIELLDARTYSCVARNDIEFTLDGNYIATVSHLTFYSESITRFYKQTRHPLFTQENNNK